MKTKTVKVKSPKTNEPKRSRLAGVQYFADLVETAPKFAFADHIGVVYYMVKLEKKFSDTYGDGYVVSVKEFPNAAETLVTGVYGSVPCQQLDALYKVTNEGRRISLTSPVAITTETVPTKHGDSYKFVSPQK